MKMELSLATMKLENVTVMIMWMAMIVANVLIGIMVIHIAKVCLNKTKSYYRKICGILFPECANCNKKGTEFCNKDDGKCICFPKVGGDNCEKCADWHYGTSTSPNYPEDCKGMFTSKDSYL